MQWYADIDGDESKVVGRLTEVVTETSRSNQGRLLGGPYHPQANSLLYLVEFDTPDGFQKAGKAALERISREGLSVTPMRYEIAYKCGEFGGP
ncbi:MAG TPA: hypothetical protein VM582_04520 [Candidatus Thermoplasmatota archaeon]|nr:hypothetical protein [Candidatus Thermoplasmatota archaeon]